MENGFTDFWLAVKEICFPSRCLACESRLANRAAILFCEACAGDIRPIREPICRRCGRPFPDAAPGNHLCGICHSYAWHFSRARSLVFYKGKLAKVIQSFKYTGNTTGLSTFAAFKKRFPLQVDVLPDIIMPVPLHPARLRERGFNQALVLARIFFPKESKRIDPLNLTRHRPTLPQTGLKGGERKKNIKGAFRVRDPEKIVGRKILLIDDVYTTGATVDECARVLKRAGALDVQVLTLARAAG